MKYGLIGEKLSHSFSKEIHEAIADYSYELCELAPAEVARFLKARSFEGINVTIPYKELVIPHLDRISEQARRIGAVNTIKNVNGMLIGDNTDLYGMKELILRAGISLCGAKVLILGSGGTSKTAEAAASELGAREILIVSRRKTEGRITYEEAYGIHGDAEIIINTTPVGMYPELSGKPIELTRFPRLRGVIDAIYNPLRTDLILDADAAGIAATGGLKMLVLQAARACEIFLGRAPDEARVERVLRDLSAAKENIVLIGMPSCGKSTVGAELSAMTGRELIDTDVIITKNTGRAPKDIIANDGEDAFRRLESEAVLEAAKRSGVIIATGGGVVTRERNIRYLRHNGRLFYLNCPVSELVVTSDRPLTASRAALSSMYLVRDPLYRKAADAVIELSHKSPPRETASTLINKFTEII